MRKLFAISRNVISLIGYLCNIKNPVESFIIMVLILVLNMCISKTLSEMDQKPHNSCQNTWSRSVRYREIDRLLKTLFS